MYKLIVQLLLLLMSCKNNTQENAGNDSTIINLDIDTGFIETADSLFGGNVLKQEEFNFLSQNLIIPDTILSETQGISYFKLIDSLKSYGLYESYLENIDLGMIKEATAFGCDTLYQENGEEYVLWGIRYSSFEACPFYFGTDIYITKIKDKKVLFTVLAGQKFGAGDAPMSYKSTLTANINDKLIAYSYSSQLIEMSEISNEEEISESQQKDFHFDLNAGKTK